MKNLKQVVDFVNKNKTKHINNLLTHASSKTLELYHSIAEDKFKTEKQAKEYFFPNSVHQNANFNRLKRNLFDRLSDIALLIDFSKSPYDDFAKAQNYCAKNIAIIKIWYYTLKTTNYIYPRAEKIVRISLKYGFSDHGLDAARICFIHFIGKNPRKAKYYRDLIDIFIRAVTAEVTTEQYFLTFVSKTLRTQKPPDSNQIQILKERLDEVKGYQSLFNSSRIYGMGSLFIIFTHEYLHQYQEVVESCYRVINTAKKSPDLYSVQLINITYLFLANHLNKLARYKEAQQVISSRLPFYKPGSLNWYSILFYDFIVKAHSKKYIESYSIYIEARSHSKFPRTSDTMKEKWYVNEAYIHYLIRTKQLKVENSINPFSIDKFLNRVPIQRNDKGGYEISIMIIEIIHRLLDGMKGHDILEEKKQHYEVYMKKYLKNNYTFRAFCFLKMLITVINSNFHPVRTQAHIKDKGYLKKLKSLPYAEAKQAEDIEIIPFETLWQIVLDNLKT